MQQKTKFRPEGMPQLRNGFLAPFLPDVLVTSNEIQRDLCLRAAYMEEPSMYNGIIGNLLRRGYTRRDKDSNSAVTARRIWADDGVPSANIPAGLGFPTSPV